MIPNKVYRHCSSLDLDTMISWVEKITSNGDILAGVRYWNRHYKIFQGYFDIVHIKKNDFCKWKEVKNETPVRTSI